MQPDGRAGSFERRHALRQESRDESREHVATSSRRQPRRRVGVDRGPAIGRRDDSIGPFENDDGAGQSRRIACTIELRGPERRDIGEDPRELALVRGHDDSAIRLGADRRKEFGWASRNV